MFFHECTMHDKNQSEMWGGDEVRKKYFYILDLNQVEVQNAKKVFV